MNTKRIIFWVVFLIIIALIVWGLSIAMKKQPGTGSTPRLSTPAVGTEHAIGPATAPVTIVEYSDFQCPACAVYFPLVEKLLAEYPTSVRLIYRHYPLPQHLNAPAASQASEAANAQGKFWEMYRLLFENQNSWENLSEKDAVVAFEGYATKLGLSLEKFRVDVNSDATKIKIRGDLESGIASGVNATPTFFVNGIFIQNPTSYDAFKKIIDTAITAAAR